MPYDDSLASKTEDWIRAQIVALAEIPDDQVEVYQGSLGDGGQRLVEELKTKRTPFCFVLFEGDRPIVLEEGAQAYEPTYAVYAVVNNRRAGAARVGEDATTFGTNLLRDLLRNALHDKAPALSANGFYTDRTEFRGARIVYEERGTFIMRCELAVRESPLG